MISRRNILDLIGMHRGKYHSCILTCYSLDFSFFEERVLPTLRAANIKNVNVFVDGKFLEQAQDATTGHEFKFNKTYNFQPVYTKGVFHPKILLLLGVKHGLLIIGSGNITSSGLSTNDEIWGAFHLNNVENENSYLFGDVWNYLQQFVNETFGFIPQKIEWIRKYSPWLADLPLSKGESYLESLNQHISFLSNTVEKSIFQQLIERVPKEDIDSLTIISPYFDQKGELLKELKSYYQPEKLNCILDLEYGLLPYDLDSETSASIKFYDWSTCLNDFNQEVNRLHAKIFHFVFKNGTEYMMLGSANATNAAIGTLKTKPVNHEAGIIIKRFSATKTWLEELQIKFPEKSITIDSKNKNDGNTRQTDQRPDYKTRILYTELRGNEVSIYIKNEIELDCKVVLFSRNSAELERVSYDKKDKRLIAKCNNPEDLFKVHLIDNSDNIITNYCIVHRFDALIKCNPDPQQEKLDGLLEQDYPGGEGITELLQFVDYNWADEEIKNKSSFSFGTGFVHKTKTTSSLDKYEKLTAEEFNKISDEMFLKQTGEMSHSSVKIADFLGIVGSELGIKSSDDFSESEEQKLLEDLEQQGEGNAVVSIKNRTIDAIKERNAINRYFHKLNEQYSNLLQPFYKSKALSVTPNGVINIKALSNILIGLQLIQIYHGKKFDVEINSETSEEKEFRQEKYLNDGDLHSGYKTVKGFIIDVFGEFLLLCTGGMKEYEYDMLNQKLNHYRSQVLEKIIFITLNLYWRENEMEYRNNLLLNTLYYINPDPVNFMEFPTNLKRNLMKHRSDAKYVSQSFDDNFKYFTDSFLPKYIRWQTMFNDSELRKELIKDTNLVYEGAVIFNSKIGFNTIHKTNRDVISPVISFKRVGYVFDDELKQNLWSDIAFFKKCVKYD